MDRAAFIESAIQVAIRRGDFDDLPGAGKPIEGLGTHHDPDWWIRRKIEIDPEKPQVLKTVRGAGYIFVSRAR